MNSTDAKAWRAVYERNYLPAYLAKATSNVNAIGSEITASDAMAAWATCRGVHHARIRVEADSLLTFLCAAETFQ